MTTASDEQGEERLAELNGMIGELGVDLTLTKGNSISCFFICSSKEQLQQLHDRYDSGHMKRVLEKIFTLLANKDEAVVIRKLQWSSDHRHKIMERLDRLSALDNGNQRRYRSISV